jgi:hypothetical protein
VPFYRYRYPSGARLDPAASGHALEPIRALPPDTARHHPIAPDVAQDPQVDADVDVASITFTDAAGNR